MRGGQYGNPQCSEEVLRRPDLALGIGNGQI
jgi:hypothetical protein